MVIGSLIASKFNLKVGDTLMIKSWVGDRPLDSTFNLKVSGIAKSTGTQWDRTLFSSVTQAQIILEQNKSATSEISIWGSQVLNYFLIDLKPNGFSGLENLINKRTVGQVIKVSDQKEHLRQLTGAGRSVGIFVTAFVIILGGLSVSSMLTTRFEGMSLQFAVLRAIGYTKKQLSLWLILEGMLLAMMGIFLGALMDFFGFPILRNLLGSSLPSPDLIASSVFDSALIWATGFLAVLISVIIPVLKMLKQDAHNALKGL